MVLRSSRFLTTPFNREIPTTTQQEEFNECDVVWSSTLEESLPPTTTTTATTAITSAVEIPPISPTTTAGLSTALLSPQSPTSVQRKTTSSPVAMISSSFRRGGDGPGLGTSYYGKRFNQSAPVNVPVWPNGLKSGSGSGLTRFDEVDDDDDGYEDEEGMVPPHEIVARSQGTTSFSVFEGAGRTLKGRDLTRVRNAVFQKTGFIE